MGSVDTHNHLVMGLTTKCDSMLTTLGWACEELFGSYVFHGAQTVFLLMKSAVAFHCLIEEKVSVNEHV